MSKTTTKTKCVNNNDKPHTIGCKVDGRLLCIVDKAHIDDIDICHFETARSTKNNKKIRDDKAKLAIETKCLIDNVFLQPNFDARGKNRPIQNLQLCGTQGEVCSLALIDFGLYIHRYEYDISMKRSLLDFSDVLLSWIRTLMSFRKYCHATLDAFTLSVLESPRTIHEALGRDKPLSTHKYEYSPFWVRGTIFLPTLTNPMPVFPENFLTSPTKLDDICIPKTKMTSNFYLNDGSHVSSIYAPTMNSVEKLNIVHNNEKRKHHKQIPVTNKKQKQNK